MKRAMTVAMAMLAFLCFAGCGAPMSQPMEPDEPRPSEFEQKTTKVPFGIDAEQTSDDPTYGYTIGHPIKLGGPKSSGDPRFERQYLRQLRDGKFRPIRFKWVGSFGGNPDGHNTDRYDIINQDGNRSTLYIDMYHMGMLPLEVKAPKGMYLQK